MPARSLGSSLDMAATVIDCLNLNCATPGGVGGYLVPDSGGLRRFAASTHRLPSTIPGGIDGFWPTAHLGRQISKLN